MLTRKRWTPPNIPPSLPAELQEYIRTQNKSISDYLLSLESPDSLTINEASITASNGIIFPSGTMADYNPTSWTPTITSGTGSFTTVSGTGVYTQIGREVFYTVVITITTNGTAATDVRFTTPFTSATLAPFSGFESAVVGIVLGGYLSGTTGIVYTYNTLYPGGTGRVLTIRGSCYV